MLTSRGPNIDPCGNPRVIGIIRSYLRLILLFGNGYLGNLLAVCRLLCSHRIRGTSQSTDRVARNQKLGLNPLQLTQLIRPCLKTTSIPHTYVLMRIGIHICSWMPTRISKIYFQNMLPFDLTLIVRKSLTWQSKCAQAYNFLFVGHFLSYIAAIIHQISDYPGRGIGRCSLSGVSDYFDRNKISSGGDLSHYSSASLY